MARNDLLFFKNFDPLTLCLFEIKFAAAEIPMCQQANRLATGECYPMLSAIH